MTNNTIHAMIIDAVAHDERIGAIAREYFLEGGFDDVTLNEMYFSIMMM